MVDRKTHNHCKSGKLFIVATPVGNLKDITLRAIEILQTADLVACEDTRHAGVLFKAHGIETPKTSLHEHNESAKAPALIRRIAEGETVALISDAGTPLINDPGWRLVQAALQRKLRVEWIPGASALIGGLVLSGMRTDRFVYEGFLSVKGAQRRRQLDALKEESRSVVLYESPHRIVKTLQAIADSFGDIPVSCSRELTKQFEETLRERAGVLIEHFSKHKPRGEFVLVFQPKGK